MTQCGSTDTTTGEPCRFTPAEKCPHHPGPSPAGRPSKYDPDTAQFVCRQIAQGKSLREVCRNDPDLPHASTIVRWAQDDRDGFSQRYARACRIRLHVLAEELLEISDDGRNDTYVDEDGHEHTNHDVIQRSKLRVDTRKWLLSKLKPEKYGKRQKVEHSGEVEVDHSSLEISVVDRRGEED